MALTNKVERVQRTNSDTERWPAGPLTLQIKKSYDQLYKIPQKVKQKYIYSVSVIKKLALILKTTQKRFYEYCTSKEFRERNSFIDVPESFFYKDGKRLATLIRPLLCLNAYWLVFKHTLVSVENIYNSIGHLTVEINELCKFIDKNKKCKKILFIYPKNNILGEFAPLLRRSPIEVRGNGLLHFWYQLTAIAYPQISIGKALSNVNYLHGKNKLSVADDLMGRVSENIRRYAKNPDFLPLIKYVRDFSWDDEYVKFIKKCKPYAVLQIKTNLVNSTINLLEPSVFIPTIQFLKSQGYQIIFAGREDMPTEWSALGVINYAKSKFASALNDFMLIYQSAIVISSASGFANIAEVLDKPILVVNGWHHVLQGGRKTMALPCLLKKSGKVLSCRQQLDFMLKSKKDQLNLPVDRHLFDFEKITELDILKATLELLGQCARDKVKKFSKTQMGVKLLFIDTPLGFGLSRIPNFYLRKHSNVFL